MPLRDMAQDLVGVVEALQAPDHPLGESVRAGKTAPHDAVPQCGHRPALSRGEQPAHLRGDCGQQLQEGLALHRTTAMTRHGSALQRTVGLDEQLEPKWLRRV